MNAPDGKHAGRAPIINKRQLRDCLGHFPTGVTVVTCRRGELVHGATVNAFTSVSLDPPLVLISLDRRSRTARLLGAGRYVINILAEDQQDLALHFAGKPMAGPVRWAPGEGADAPPRLANTVAHLVCRTWHGYDGGDHVLHVGAVEDLLVHGGRPLLFSQGDFPQLAADTQGAPWAWSLDDPVALAQFDAVHPRTGPSTGDTL